MDNISGLMQFRYGRIKSLSFTPAEEDPTASLELTADMTPDIARSMGIHDALYRADGAPHQGPTRVDIGEARLRDIDLSLPSPTVSDQYDMYRPEIIHSFRIDRDKKSDNRLRVHLLARVKGRFEDLIEFFLETNKGEFEFAIRSLQQEFDWTAPSETKGQKVDMSGKREEDGPLFNQGQQPACALCDLGVPRNADGRHMKAGELLDCPRENPEASNAEAKEVVAGPVLASSNHMGQRRQKKQATRGDVAVMERGEGEEPAFPVQ